MKVNRQVANAYLPASLIFWPALFTASPVFLAAALAASAAFSVAFFAAAAVLSIAAQGGDLAESSIKRQFGVKDASHIIPGHGGVMDRLDGFIVAALLAVLIGLARGGLDNPGRGLLVW